MYYNMFYLVHPDINIYFCRKHRKCKYTKKASLWKQFGFSIIGLLMAS